MELWAICGFLPSSSPHYLLLKFTRIRPNNQRLKRYSSQSHFELFTLQFSGCLLWYLYAKKSFWKDSVLFWKFDWPLVKPAWLWYSFPKVQNRKETEGDPSCHIKFSSSYSVYTWPSILSKKLFSIKTKTICGAPQKITFPRQCAPWQLFDRTNILFSFGISGFTI